MPARVIVLFLSIALLALPTVQAEPPVSSVSLDLDVYAGIRPVWPPRGSSRPPLPMELWRPGTPLALRGESPGVVALSYAGYTAMGAVAFTESLNGLGKDPNAARNAVGFGLITAIQLWSGWSFMKDAFLGASSQPDPGRPAGKR